MTAHRPLARIALLGAAPLLLAGLIATPAQAHGAPDSPVSRAVACGPEGGQNAVSAACKAAIAVSGADAFAQWDNLRVANVRGRDRQVIPDGKLCSGGLPAYRGLDQPRADWPATRLTAGAAFTFRYRETIPHTGTFRMYVTKDGYDPSQPLKWSDLEAKPFLTATDPPLTNSAYVMQGKLPAGKTGRHLIYTIWQNSNTPDTYYSCSDAVFAGGSGATAPTKAAAPANPDPAADPNVVAPTGAAAPGAGGGGAGGTPGTDYEAGAPVQQQPGASREPSTVAVSKTSQSSVLPLAITGVGAVMLAGVGVAATVLFRRRRASMPRTG